MHRFFIRRSCHLLTLMASILLLSACGSGGPSKAEASAALDELASQFAQMLGGDKNIHINVVDLTCEKAGDDTYNCQVLIDAQGQQTQDRYQFTRLSGKWRATHLN